ncbi:GNAT family N-acetyltransferase [Antarctobacter jejuensis]|uniref:GNAT family N-acetyltransferase n=1 Tax=Antarctobacter jejuensis TaxID=1439938 RepID=UPI003FD47547
MDALSVTLEPITQADAEVEALLTAHHALMRSQSPEESCHVMTATALRAEGAHVFALRDAAGATCAVGAFKILPKDAAPVDLAGQGPVIELKSMHVAGAMRGRGLGHILLTRILDVARAQGVTGACLETGTAPAFSAARQLYRAQGFAECPPFGAYRTDPLSVFMSRSL